MSKKPGTIGALLGLYAHTAMHPGTGTALGTVDLPIQRERHTLWPAISGSALKGVLRDACREKLRSAGEQSRAEADKDADLVVAFGPPTMDADKHAGALSITDGRILAFPVRSLRGVFAWVTCSGVLDRLQRDAAVAGMRIDWAIPKLSPDQAIVPTDCPCVINQNCLLLEEFDFAVQQRDDPISSNDIAAWIAERLLPIAETSTAQAQDTDTFKATRQRFLSSLVILHDDDFTHFVRYATEISARIRLNYDTKTVVRGALFYQEFLPPETVLYSLVLANGARTSSGGDADTVMKTLRESLPALLQIGGDETTGKGFCIPRLAS